MQREDIYNELLKTKKEYDILKIESQVYLFISLERQTTDCQIQKCCKYCRNKSIVKNLICG